MLYPFFPVPYKTNFPFPSRVKTQFPFPCFMSLYKHVSPIPVPHNKYILPCFPFPYKSVRVSRTSTRSEITTLGYSTFWKASPRMTTHDRIPQRECQWQRKLYLSVATTCNGARRQHIPICAYGHSLYDLRSPGMLVWVGSALHPGVPF